jgi:heterodisulfide reductase subunit C
MKIDRSFAREVEERSRQNIKLCFQCLKCFVGCPVAAHMEFKPNSVIRMIQYGLREKVLKSHAIWLCVSCMTCGVRCPNEIDMGAVFDTLRGMSVEAGYSYESERNVVMLHEEFIRSVKMWGRLHEASFFMTYMGRSFDFSNVASAPALLSRGKLRLLPTQIEGIEEVRGLIAKCLGIDRQEPKGRTQRAVHRPEAIE